MLTFARPILEAYVVKRVALLLIVFALCAVPGGTQSLPQFGGGGGATYVGYAFVECTAANTPAVRLVLLQGVPPKDLPASAPRPSACAARRKRAAATTRRRRNAPPRKAGRAR